MLVVFLHSVDTVVTWLGIFMGWLELPPGSQRLVPMLELPFLLERVIPYNGIEPFGGRWHTSMQLGARDQVTDG